MDRSGNGKAKSARSWFWVRHPGPGALLEAGQKCQFCGRWALRGVYFSEDLPGPDEPEVCGCGTRMMPAVVDLGRRELVAAAV